MRFYPGAPAHYGDDTQAWCMQNLDDFWPRDMVPPSSPDLTPLDFHIWSHILEKACRRSYPSVPTLKAAVESEWAKMPAEQIRKACASVP